MRAEQKVMQSVRDTSSSISALAENSAGEYFSEGRFFGPTDTADRLAPKPISVSVMSKRTPYTNPDRFAQLLADTAGAGYLKPDGNGGYTVSEKGASAIHAANGTFYAQVDKANQFPADKLKEVSTLLGKLVDASLKADSVNGTFCLSIVHNGHAALEAGSLAQIDQHIDDLFAFRDDSHLAAWLPSGLSGQAWEALTFVWNGEANTADKLVARLPNRSYSADDYTQALTDLTARGWVAPGADGYTVTEAGRKIREDAETATDSNFFAPWQTLTDAELTKLGHLLNELNQTNLKIVEAHKTK